MWADRFMVLRRMLWLVLFSILTVVLGNAVLIGVPQARETLFALDDGDGAMPMWRSLIFCAAYLYWAFCAWLTARLVLGRRFPRDLVDPPPALAAWTAACACWIPRTLGLLATLPLAVVMFWHKPLLGVVMLVLAALFIAFLIFRHRIGWLADRLRRQQGQVVAPASEGGAAALMGGDRSAYAYFERMGPRALRFVIALFVLSWLIFAATWAWPVATGRALGAPVLLLVALGAWTLFGTLVLSYWPNTRGWPTLNWLPPILAALGTLADNHPVAANPPRGDCAGTVLAEEADWRAQRPLLAAHFAQWMKQHRAGEPVYMVAVAGGASRAAWWSAMTLGQLEDEARRRGARFGANTFVISSISGGSLGGAAYVSALAARSAPAAFGRPAPGVTPLLEDLLGRDFLGPVVGMMLYPDLVQRALPLLDRLHPTDRSRALEDAWSAGWREVAARHAEVPSASPPRGHQWWCEPISAPYREMAPSAPLPSLVLNTVRLEDGQRMLQSNLAFELPDAFDLLGARFDTRALTLAGAVHNSARFPYVSPAGQVRLAPAGDQRGPRWGMLGDGGYHEASGAATLADIVEVLLAQGLLKRDEPGRLVACDGTDCRSPLVLLMLENQPSAFGPAWRRQIDGTPRTPDATRVASPWPATELTAPMQGLIRAWTSNGERAEWRLSRLAGPAPGGYVELRMPLCAMAEQPSMTWHLSAASRAAMKKIAAEGCEREAEDNQAHAALRANLQRLREGFKPAP